VAYITTTMLRILFLLGVYVVNLSAKIKKNNIGGTYISYGKTLIL